jgi:catechol 2,3-dioxygenase-like lactoylglutathione lyase family enzyme
MQKSMAEVKTKPIVMNVVPIARVADVQRTVDFYKMFGMEVRSFLHNPSGELQWVHIFCDQAELMFSRASDSAIPVQREPGQRDVLFYFYAADLLSLRNHLLANGVKVSEVTYPSYMPKGEVCASDPDGYEVFIGQAG